MISSYIPFFSEEKFYRNRKKFTGSIKNWPDEVADGGVGTISFKNDFNLRINDSKFHRDYSVGSEIEHSEMEFCFCVSGKCMGESGCGDKFFLENGKSGIFYSERPGTKIVFDSEDVYRAVVIQVKPHVLTGWFKTDRTCLSGAESFSGIRPKDYHFNVIQKIKSSSKMVIEQILNCPLCGNTAKLYLEAKAMELIALMIHQMNISPEFSKSFQSFSPDKNKIYEARDILVYDLENPPSLSKLCSLTGLNKNLLNKGFKEVFGSTVFDYLREFKLEKSKEWIEEEGRNTSITEIAFRAGYSQPASFSRAFSRKFGAPPKDFIW